MERTRNLLGCLLAVVILGIGAYYAWMGPWTTQGAGVIVFAQYPPRGPTWTAYYGRAATELDRYPRARGFAPGAKPFFTTTYIGDHRDRSYYLRGGTCSPEMCVEVCLPTADADDTGLEADVDYRVTGMSPHRHAVKAEADLLIAQLEAWWAKYQRDNGRR